MLNVLDIQNVALIDKVSLDFSANLNVLSGETGAGKSIIIDSLNFVLGGKANKSLIKQGCDFMKVVASFSAPFITEIKNILEELDVEYDDEIVVSRKLTKEGKGDLRVNGVIVPVNNFKKLSVLLVDIHGQHEHQKLLKDKYHLEIIDNFIKNNKIFKEYYEIYSQLKNINSEINKLNGSTENQERMLDLLSYQIKEIESAELKENEDEILTQKRLIMQNSEKIYEGLNNAFNCFDKSGALIESAKDASSYLNSISKFDESLIDIADRIDSIKYEAMDIASTIKEKREECEFDEYEFEKVDDRLDKIKQLKRKYGPTLDDVFSFLEKAKKDYDDILNSRDKLEKCLKEKEGIINILFNKANEIHNLRVKVASDFEKKTNHELSDLGMKSARFKVEFSETPDLDAFEKKVNSNGYDSVRFLFSANAGQDLKPLSEVISGGEASRFMLALKNILADVDNISLMVFDEIDTGISGEMGYKVACKLANISRNHQVISVSHLPQICAMADKNIFVKKETIDNSTVVSVINLNNDTTLDEIARLAGGEHNSSVALEHARALKARCESYKKNIT